MHLLIVDDDEPVLAFLERGLEAEHYTVDTAIDAFGAEGLADAHDYDLVILDLNLPHADGLDLLKRLRSQAKAVPVLVLSSRREVEERVRSLDLGADDFLAKPFAFSELSARVRALLRRSSRGFEPVLRVEDLELYRIDRRAKRGERPIELTPKELALLEYLMQNAGRCVTRSMIIEHVWKLAPDTVSNVVDVYVNYLRKKIDEGAPVRLIHTLRGSGYYVGLKSERGLNISAGAAAHPARRTPADAGGANEHGN
ncbi:MAG: response regulator transcription factor [Terriglobia bacterium]